MEDSWIDLQDGTPDSAGTYRVFIEGLGDKTSRRESLARWQDPRFELVDDVLKNDEYIDKWKDPGDQ